MTSMSKNLIPNSSKVQYSTVHYSTLPDPELELLRDVQVLVLEGALEAALGLARAGVVAAGEEELVEPE